MGGESSSDVVECEGAADGGDVGGEFEGVGGGGCGGFQVLGLHVAGCQDGVAERGASVAALQAACRDGLMGEPFGVLAVAQVPQAVSDFPEAPLLHRIRDDQVFAKFDTAAADRCLGSGDG